MKKFSVAIVVLMLATALSSFVSPKRPIYQCYGHSDYTLSPGILITVFKNINSSNLWIQMDFKGLPQNIAVVPQNLSPEEMVLTETFINQKLELRLDIFLDDMGDASSLWFHNKKYSLSCQTY